MAGFSFPWNGSVSSWPFPALLLWLTEFFYFYFFWFWLHAVVPCKEKTSWFGRSKRESMSNCLVYHVVPLISL